MPTITPTLTSIGDGVVVAKWEGAAGSDTCLPISIPRYPDRTIQIIGDATSVALHGSMDNSTFVALSDWLGAAISLAGATDDITVVAENALYLKPVVTGGSDTDIYIVGTTHR